MKKDIKKAMEEMQKPFLKRRFSDKEVILACFWLIYRCAKSSNLSFEEITEKFVEAWKKYEKANPTGENE